MKTIIASPGTVLSLGREGENAVRQIIFDITDWHSEFGKNGVVTLLAQRPGEAEPYPVAVTVSGSSVTWPVSAADTAKPGVYGQAELQYRIGDVVVKSAIWRTFIADSLGMPSPTPPEPQQAWVDQVLEAAQQVEKAVASTPKIQNGTWWVWNFESGAYVDTGVQAQGPAGVAPKPTHINLKDDYGIDLVQQVLVNIMVGRMEFTIPFPAAQQFFETINAAQGSIWIDTATSDSSVYSALINGKSIGENGIFWVDAKIAIYSGGWISGLFGVDNTAIYVRITDAPTIE